MGGTPLELRGARRAGFRWAAGAFVAGCAAAPALTPAAFFAGLGAFLLAVLVLVIRRRNAALAAILAVPFALAGWGWCQVQLADIARTEALTAPWALGEAPLSVRVDRPSKASEIGVTYDGVTQTPWGEIGVRVAVPGNVRVAPGTVLEGKALLGRPEGPNASAWGLFRSRGTYLSAYFASPRSVPGEPGWIERFRKGALDIFTKTYPEGARGIVAGALLGEKSLLGAQTLQDFRKSGLAHILVASGSNVAIVLAVLAVFARRLPGWFGAAFPLAGAVLFTVLAGGDAPVARAAVMGLVAAAAVGGGRKIDGGHALLGALCLFAAFNPLAVSSDPSLRLSFAATAGVLFLSKPAQRLLGWVTESFGLREAFAVTLAATVATLPVGVADFATASLAAIPANLLAGWSVAPIMGFGAASAAFAWWAPLRDLLGCGTWIFAKWLSTMATWAAGWAWANVAVSGPLAVATSCVPAALLVWYGHKKAGQGPGMDEKEAF